jgi:two-component system chemotaxis response regulator CheY
MEPPKPSSATLKGNSEDSGSYKQDLRGANEMALNLLVVDDSAVMRAMIIRAIGLTGLPVNSVHQASNGQEALEVLGHEWIDLALVDINMPVMDGVELISRIRKTQETSNLPIIVVSTESSATRISMLEQQGAKFVHKPFSPESLRATVTDLTGVSCE